MASLKRLAKEVEEITKDIKNGVLINCSASPINNNLYKWEGTIIGPPDSLYEGGIFKVSINFPNNYPFNPPQVNFITKIYHPNISNGNICLDILKNNWSPSLNITKVLLSISSLLTDPNINDPYNSEAARLYRDERDKYNETVKSYVRKFAME